MRRFAVALASTLAIAAVIAGSAGSRTSKSAVTGDNLLVMLP
jgi:hypothetical protein